MADNIGTIIGIDEAKKHEGRTLSVVGDTLQVLQSGEAFEVFEVAGTVDNGPPPHAHPWVESYYGLAGEIEISASDTTTILRSGDFISVPAGAVHTFRTLTQDARFLLMTSGDRASLFFADIEANVPPSKRMCRPECRPRRACPPWWK